MPDNVPAPRPSSVRKRAAVLTAGRELFVSEGYERTSVDTIAARAGISKRTVYDYFGGKDGVFDAVIEDVATELAGIARAAVEDELTPDRDVRTALLAFVRRIATRTFTSSAYRFLQQLVIAGRTVPGRDLAELYDLPEVLLAAHFDELAERGVLRLSDSYRAAQHLIALTFLLALDVTRSAPGELADIDVLLIDGVDAFLRAYGA